MGNTTTRSGADISLTHKAQTLMAETGDLQQLLSVFQDNKNSRDPYLHLNKMKVGDPDMSYCQYCINMANLEMFKQNLDDPVTTQHFILARDMVSTK